MKTFLKSTAGLPPDKIVCCTLNNINNTKTELTRHITFWPTPHTVNTNELICSLQAIQWLQVH